MTDDAGSPAFRYYHGLQGAWTGTMTTTIGDAADFAQLPLAARLLARLGMETTMSTTLAGASADTFLHTTRVSLWGVSLATSCEQMLLAADGHSGRMAGDERVLFGGTRAYEASLEVDETATRATYHIPWGAIEILQRTRIVPEGLELTQDLPGLRVAVLLRRRPTTG